jgi:hypothetical protein
MSWAGYVAHIRKMRSVSGILTVCFKERKTFGEKMQTGFISLMTGASG